MTQPMARHLETLITNVREREIQRRRIIYLIGTATLCMFLSVTVTLASWYPLWAALAWSALIIPLAIFLARGEHPSLSVSSEYASAIIDSHAALKGRVITYTSLAHSAAAPDALYRSFIAEQVALAQPPIPPAEKLVSLKLTGHQRLCIAISLGCLVLSISLLFARPRTPYEAIADQLVATLDRHPELPEEVRVAVSDLAREIAQGDASIDELSASIESAQDDVTRALAEESVAQGKEISAPQGNRARDRSRPSPIPTSTPQPSSTDERKQGQEDQSSKEEKGKSGEKPSAEGAGKSQERQGSSSSQSSQSQKGSSQSESKNDGAKQKESQGASGEQESQDAKEQESGSGQGAGSGSSGSGSQQSDGAQQQEGKGSGDGKGKGQGAGSDQNEQGAQDQTSGKSGAQSGRPQESASGSQSGLEDLQQALNQAQQELKKQEESAQKSAGSQSSAQGEKEGQKGEAKNSQRGSAQGKDQGKEEGKDQGKEQGGSRGGAGEKQPKDSSKKAQSDKSTQGSQGAGNEGSSQKEKNRSNPESKGDSGKGEGERPQDNQSQEEGDEREPQDGKSEGVGERSSLPDRSATARVEDQSAEGGESASGDGAPKTFKESEITSKDEAFDARYTGADSSLEKSSKEAQPKVSLEDVTLAKPKGSSQRGEQPIPLEYKGILE